MQGNAILLPPGVPVTEEEIEKDLEAKGQPKAEGLPVDKLQAAAMMIVFDPKTQGVQVMLNEAHVRNWNFAKGLLHQAIDAVDLQLKMLHMQAMQASAIEQQQAAAMQAQLARRGR